MKRAWRWRFSSGLLLIAGLAVFETAAAQSLLEQARDYQQRGQTAQVLTAINSLLKQEPHQPAILAETAALLDLAGAPNRTEAYRRVLEAAPPGGTEAQAARRRLVLLYLQAGAYEEARRELETYRNNGGTDLAGWPAAPTAPRLAAGYIEIPGPLLGFQRMAAMRPATPLEDLLPALARNVSMFGYQYSQRQMKVTPSEYLKLLKAYLEQARELRGLAGKDRVLRVSNCADAAPLLNIIGYRLRGSCGAASLTTLEVDDPRSAFLTINSGFPLLELEETIQGKRAFEHSVEPVRVPLLPGTGGWLQAGDASIDRFLDDRQLTRLYVALSQIDSRTAELLQSSLNIEKLKALGPVLDFFGHTMRVEGGQAVVPGGPGAAAAWKQLAGVGPDRPAAFFASLLEKDDGWMAAYFETLSRVDGALQVYFTEPARLARFYRALRGRITAPGPARPIFRSNAQLILLSSRLRIRADGTPYLPGGVGTWKAILRLRPARSPGVRKTRQVSSPQTPDEVVEALFARVRDADENGALSLFLTLNEIDRLRAKPLAGDTILLLTAHYPRFSHHYHLFAEWPQLGDSTVERFLDVAESLTQVRDPMARADALGSFQALVALWGILARQGEIREAQIEPSLNQLLSAFSEVETAGQAFDAARRGLQMLLSVAATDQGLPPGGALPVAGDGGTKAAATLQERIVALLAAPPGIGDEARPIRDEIAAQIRAALDAQRLIPLDTLFELADQLERAAKTGVRPGPEFVRLAAGIRELNLPNPFPTAMEKNAAFFGYWTERHILAERETDLARVAQRESLDKLANARALLAPHLRDTLVGLVYAYYAPPGSALLSNNPLFARSHDFLGLSGKGTGNEIWGPGRVSGLGWPLSAGGRFVGSLSGIAYALADAEKDFLVPQQTQALIWGELVPQVLVSASVPRWWRVSSTTQHWVALNIRLGRDLLAEAAVSAEARAVILDSLALEPHRQQELERELAQGRAGQAIRLVTPAELHRLSRAVAAGRGELARRVGPAAAALEEMERRFPTEASAAAASAAFGVPHPKIARSFRPELLNLPLFPTLLGHSSRLLAETWESGNLYWAELADEMGLPPSELNRLAPQLTRRMLERVFANDLEDWPALLNAMLATGDEFRSKYQQALTRATEPAQ